MIPLWLTLLRTPMAAPETPALRRMRLGWQSLCLALASSILVLPLLEPMAGVIAPGLTAILLLTTPAYGLHYFRRKSRADDAWIAARSEPS